MRWWTESTSPAISLRMSPASAVDVVRVGELGEAAAGQLGGVVAGQLAERAVGVDDAAVERGDDHPGGRLVEDAAEQVLTRGEDGGAASQQASQAGDDSRAGAHTGYSASAGRR